MKRWVPLLLLVCLAGCKTYDLGPEWRPLSKLVERPATPFTSSGTVTTKGSHVYVEDIAQFLIDRPPAGVEWTALLSHEREHARRQFRYDGLPGELALAAWIARYLTDPEFMWAEEQAGYYQSITQLQAAGHWNSARTARAAAGMANAYKTILGDPMVSEAVARRWIESVILGAWKPE